MDRLKTAAVWALQFVLAGLFAVQGIVKVTGSSAWISRFKGWGYPDHFYFSIGLAELSGAIVLIIPRLAKYGASTLILVMAGATVTHLIHHEPQVMTTLVLLALLAAILYLRRGSTPTSPRKILP